MNGRVRSAVKASSYLLLVLAVTACCFIATFRQQIRLSRASLIKATMAGAKVNLRDQDTLRNALKGSAEDKFVGMPNAPTVIVGIPSSLLVTTEGIVEPGEWILKNDRLLFAVPPPSGRLPELQRANFETLRQRSAKINDLDARLSRSRYIILYPLGATFILIIWLCFSRRMTPKKKASNRKPRFSQTSSASST